MGSGQSLSVEQSAILSPHAITFLQKLPQIPFANLVAPFLTSPKRIHKLRSQVSANTNRLEEALIVKHNLLIKNITIADVPVVIIEPSTIQPENEHKILLNIFGGGFVLGSARERAAMLMAVEMGIRVYSIEYSLSPEAQYPVARDECLAVYRQLAKDFDTANILAMGSSSGGQLIVSMLLLAQKENLPMPKALYLCTPAVDLSGAGDSMVFNASRDLMPVALLIGMVKQNYEPASVDPKDPLYSPVYAEYNRHFPPTIITVGTRDCMLSSGTRLYWRFREAGVKAELLVGEGMWHGFNWEEEMPEAVAVREAVRKFLSEQ